jgi:pimeloyl-ACP methyl ester carboxylesterase
VLCLPGLTRNSRDFEQLAGHLCAQRRVLTPDLRGRGRSDYDPNPLNYNPATYLGDMLALLPAAGVERVVVIGTSLGGLLAMMLVVAMRDAVAAVVLNDVGPEIDLWPMWGQLAGIPTLVFRGELSDILAEKTLERMREEKSDLECVTVPRVGHAPLLAEPECVAALDRFLETVPGSAP